jgi:glycosyltransferase involved in cell wall biosynthesis
MSEDFSVLIPAHGSCEFLEQALESICMSSLLPDRVVIVDDGVTDLAMTAILNFSSRLVLHIEPNRGSGLVDALNTGIEVINTPFIARLDADDVVTQDRFALQVSAMLVDPDIAVLGGQVQYINSDGRFLGKSEYFTGTLNNLNQFESKCLIAHPSAMIRRRALLEVGGYRSICRKGRTDIAEDFDLWLRISKVGKVCNLNDTILFYRQHPEQLSSKHTPEQLFSTRYVSLINQASSADPFFEPIKLRLNRHKFDFLIDAYSSLSPFVSRKERVTLVLEGFLISIGMPSGIFARLIRKIIRVTANS